MTRMVLIAPVADRAWALPYWFESLAAQTVRPDEMLFMHSGRIGDSTWRALHDQADAHGFQVTVIHDRRPPHARHDNARFETLASLRNGLLQVTADHLHADQVLSLDTDVMLEDPCTLQRLAEHLHAGADLASPAVFLHPGASDPNVDRDLFWAYNAGWWTPGGTAGDPRRPWDRPWPDSIDWTVAQLIDIPMACWLATSRVLKCRYAWHHSGEDLGFAQDLEAHDIACLWDPTIRARHIWQANHLPGTHENPIAVTQVS